MKSKLDDFVQFACVLFDLDRLLDKTVTKIDLR